jgi:Rad3-related DNA helicase
MSHGTDKHLEEIEHNQHAAAQPFDRKVAVSMAIVAAVLAGLTMMAHRAHNQTLLLQTEAAAQQVAASNAWAQYQAKRLRQAQYQAYRQQLPLMAAAPGTEDERKKALTEWDKTIAEYAAELKEIKEKAEGFEKKAEETLHGSHDAHHRADRFDWSELAVQLALVLCSLAVLTKRPLFWYAGLGLCVIGLAIGGSVAMMH